ncbi:unnamed protein product [Rhizophagus irregularis]|uniref:Uncharacterized protein n=3 Tax=Rhizophagus irregularis TaxID=588596 RepID=A0A915ZE67_9GLOM|nr:hypothetical protein RirG_111110 [Rhizophagus irregularis DAOM 197198w]GET56378.1 C2H2-type zinc finger transcription factor [Rhizophagus irregularis DAOM 181602=DAOM 197198]CAB4486220.1 unnamed protein product [Rhizophagus irregularis]CAB5193577.1 unnamed protein product [Rhizophagus irregularis]CAB5373075.1 unnamed protein product [Rhizophagus irregularis]
MNAYDYRAPLDSNVSLYFKTFPLSVWSHKHFIQNTDILDFEQATRLWYENLTTIRRLPDSLVSKKLFDVITKRKMGDAFTINEKKRKHAEDEVHTSSVTTSAELLKDTFEHHRKHTKQKLDAPTTPSNVAPTVTSVVNRPKSPNEVLIPADGNDEPGTKNIEFDQYIDDENFIQEKLLLNDSYIPEANVDDTPYMFQGKNISTLLTSYQSEASRIGQTSGLSIVTNYHEILSLSNILLLQSDKFSELQVKKFSRNTLTSLRKNMCDIHMMKAKVTSTVKSIFREYVEIAIDEDLGLEKAEKAVRESFTKTFPSTTDQNMFDIIQFIFLQLTKNIPIKPLDDLLSEGTLTVNIISPVLRSFFHDSTFHPTIWPNTASMSAKARKLANLDPSRAKQPDMVGNITNNNKSVFEVMYGEITGEGKNNNIRKNTLDLIRIGVFMKDALDDIIKKTGRCCVIFGWQTIAWTGYMMVLTAPGIYIMFEVGQAELPRSFRTCGQFIDCIDSLFMFAEKYKHEIRKIYSYINQEKEDSAKLVSWCRSTLGTPQFRKLIDK